MRSIIEEARVHATSSAPALHLCRNTYACNVCTQPFCFPHLKRITRFNLRASAMAMPAAVPAVLPAVLPPPAVPAVAPLVPPPAVLVAAPLIPPLPAVPMVVPLLPPPPLPAPLPDWLLPEDDTKQQMVFLVSLSVIFCQRRLLQLHWPVLHLCAMCSSSPVSRFWTPWPMLYNIQQCVEGGAGPG